MAIVERDLGPVIGPEGPVGKAANIASATGKVNPGHSDEPTVTIEVGGSAGANTLDFTFDGLQGTDATLPIATNDLLGKVKPDGTSITVDTDGTIKIGQVEATSLTGTVPLTNIPQGALERIVTVANEAARFELTTTTVQLGDIVQQLDTKVMYVVVDESNLSNAQGYTEFAAGIAVKATDADHATNSDNSIDSTHAGYLNYHVIDNGLDLNTLRGTENSGVYYKSSSNVTVINVPANVDPAMEAILEVIPLSINGITEQRYTTMGLQEQVHLYVRHTDTDGNWQGWVTIGPQAAVGESSHAETADNAHMANVAQQLGSVDVGTESRPIYLDEGSPKPISGSAGDFETPIYLNGGSFDTVSKVANASHADEADHTPAADIATTANNLSGILAIEHGGTGVNDLTDAANTFINALQDETTDPQDDDFFISQSTSGSDTYHRRRLSALWNWIDGHMGEIEIGTSRYADSAKTAERLTLGTVGDESTPVYFEDGIPVLVPKVALATKADEADKSNNATYADEANKASIADRVGTFNVGDEYTPIYLNSGTPTTVTKVALASMAEALGEDTIGSESLPIFIENGLPKVVTKVAEATNADVANKLGTETLGNVTTPIYLEDGVPKVANAYPDLTPYLKSADFSSTLKTSIDALPERDIADDDYVIIQAEGGDTSKAKLGVSTTDEFGLVTTEDIATTDKVGLVKPDGTTIKVTADGTISVDKVDTTTLVTKEEFVQLLKDNIEEIRTALGLATTEHMGLVPPLPSE